MNRMIESDKPIFPISVAAKLLDVHPRTLRIYEEEGLLKPARQGNKRYFSQDNIEWVRCLRKLIHDEGISIPGVKKLLDLIPCWELKKCSQEVRQKCTAFVERVKPCWQVARAICAREPGHCDGCEVFVLAMKEAKPMAAKEFRK